MAPKAVPVAVRCSDGLVLRGHEWPVDGAPVVFVHDFGEDLDAWGSVTEEVAAQGFRVISMELRGHGLSDGVPDPSLIREDLAGLLRETAASFGPVGLVGHGKVTEAMLFIDEGVGAPVQVMVSPLPLDPSAIDWRATRPAMRLLLKGALNEEVEHQFDFIYPRMRGQRMVTSAATTAASPRLLEDQPQLLEHLVIFLRRYLVGLHLAWIADRSPMSGEAVR